MTVNVVKELQHMNGRIAVKIAQTQEGPRFVTVFPMVEPRDDQRTWQQQLSRHTLHRYTPPLIDEFTGIAEAIRTRDDQSN